PRLHAAGHGRRVQRRARQRERAGVVRAQHGRVTATRVARRGVAKRHAGTSQRHPDRAGLLIHPAGELRADRRTARARGSDRFSRRQRQLRGDVRGGADGRLHWLRRRPALPDVRATGAAMARIGELPLRTFALATARAWPVVVLLLVWEGVARSGQVTPFMLPAFSDVAARIWTDAIAGDLLVNTRVTLYRALVGFFIAGMAGILIGAAMARSAVARWFFDPIVSVGFPMPKIAFLPIIMLWLGLFDVSKIAMV